MPAVSEAQRRFMAMVASGKIKRAGLSKEEAMKFVHTNGHLPQRVKNGKPAPKSEMDEKRRKILMHYVAKRKAKR